MEGFGASHKGLFGWTERLPAASRRAFRLITAVVVGSILGVTAGHSIFGSIPGPISVVQGSSMVPTFESGARVYTTSVNRTLERGDIVLVQDDRKGLAIKRIVGLPGERVQLWRGYVYINGRLLREPYLLKYTFTHPDQVIKRSRFALGSGNYFLMGDNRELSYDSRNYGPVCLGNIVGLVPQLGALPPEFAPNMLPVHGREKKTASESKQ